jgi:phage shock protein A
MGILNRISKVLESNLNALVDRAEDPAKMLDQAIDDMKKGRNEARQAIIEAKTQRRIFDKRREKAVTDSNELERKAMLALKANDEGLARKLLELKVTSDHRADMEMSACAEQDSQIAQLELAEKELDRRLAEAPAKRAALLARQASAQAKGARAGQSGKMVDSVSSALEAFERMEEKVIRSEVEAEVISETNPNKLLDTRSIEAYAADEALAALKAKMAAAQLPAGNVSGSKSKPAKEPDPIEDSLAAMKAKLRKEGGE